MLNNQRVKNRIGFLAMLLALLLIMSLAFGSVSMEVIEGHFMNTDTLYQPSLYQDLIVHDNSISTWTLNPAPNFLPDSLLYFVLMMLTGSLTWSSFLFFLIQTSIILLLFTLILKKCEVKEPWKKTSLIAIPLLILFPLVSWVNGDFLFYFYFISNSYHTGSFVNTLLIIYFIMQFTQSLENREKRARSMVFATLILVCTTLGVLSDRLLLIGLSIPSLVCLLVVLLLNWKNKRKPLLLVFVLLAAGSYLGDLSRQLLTEHGILDIEEPHSFMNFDNISNSFEIYAAQMKSYLLAFDFKSLVVSLSFVALIVHILSLIKSFRSSRTGSALFFVQLFIVLSSTCLILAPILAGNYTGPDTIRYNYHVFILLIMSFVLIIKLPEKVTSNALKVSLSFLVVSVSVFTFSSNHLQLQAYFNLYPAKAKAADEFARLTGLKYGTGDYWDAKVITLFSKEGVVVVPTFYNTVPYFHANNKRWYFKNNFNDQKREFEFSIIDFVEREDQLRSIFENNVDTMSAGGYQFAIHPAYTYNEDLTITKSGN